MNRRLINQMSAIAPIVLSVAAFALVLGAVIFGWDRGLTDEGAVAHSFQLLIGAQIPLVLIFLVTAQHDRWAPLARTLALQVLAALPALAVVRFLT